MRRFWSLFGVLSIACACTCALATATAPPATSLANSTHGASTNATTSNATMANANTTAHNATAKTKTATNATATANTSATTMRTDTNTSANVTGMAPHANATHQSHCPPLEESSKFEGESYLLTGLGLGLHIHNKTGHVCKSRNNGRFDAWHIERKGCTGNKYVFRSEFGYLGLEPKSKSKSMPKRGPKPESDETGDSEPVSRCRHDALDHGPLYARFRSSLQAQSPQEEEHEPSNKKADKENHPDRKKTRGAIEYKLVGNATEPVEWSVFVLLPDKRILLSHKKMVLTFDSRCLALTHDFSAAKLLKIQNVKLSEDEDE